MKTAEELAQGCERIAAYNDRKAQEEPANRERWRALAASERAMTAQLRALPTPPPPTSSAPASAPPSSTRSGDERPSCTVCGDDARFCSMCGGKAMREERKG